MTASDIFNFAIPIIQGMGPAILVTAIIANSGEMVNLFYKLFARRWY